MEWISVKDSLPETTSNGTFRSSNYVLIYPDCVKARYEEALDKRWTQWYSPFIDDTLEVTHWMPLPEPPKD